MYGTMVRAGQLKCLGLIFNSIKRIVSSPKHQEGFWGHFSGGNSAGYWCFSPPSAEFTNVWRYIHIQYPRCLYGKHWEKVVLVPQIPWIFFIYWHV